MTLKEKLVKLGEENGLWPQESVEIADALIAQDDGTMGGRWNDEADGYPPQMLAVLWVSFKCVADKWLGKHKPNHWARPMFANAEH